MFKTTKRIAEMRDQIRKCQFDLSVAQSHAQAFFHHGQRHAELLDSYYISLLAKNQEAVLDLLASHSPASGAAWNSDLWNSWNASIGSEDKLIRLGEMREQEPPQFFVPAYGPFIGAHKTIIIRSDGPNAAQGLSLLHSLVVRTVCLLPHQ